VAQIPCANTQCEGIIIPGERFCGECGEPARAPAPPPVTDRYGFWPPNEPGVMPRGSRHAATFADTEPFFSHEPPRPSGPLNNATRFLCAAAYLDNGFANKVIWHLLATHRAVAPSVNFDVGPVLRHCLRARKLILIRDAVLCAVVIAGLVISIKATIGFLVITLVLTCILPSSRHIQGSKRRSVIGALIGLGVVIFLLGTIGSVGSSVTDGSSPFSAVVHGVGSDFGGGQSPIVLVAVLLLLLAVSLATEFFYIRSTFETLAVSVRRGAEPPVPGSSLMKERVAMVEGAQRGNITLHSGWWPFIGAGVQSDAHWSIAIRLVRVDPERQALGKRELRDQYVAIDPVDLHRVIRERLESLNHPGLPVNERISSLTVTDRIVGHGLLPPGSPLFDTTLSTPYSHASPEAVEALIHHPQAGLRYYQQVSMNDESSVVTSRDREVIAAVDQEVAVSAFVYAAVEGRMLYLQYVLTALPPIRDAYRSISVRYGSTPDGMLMYSAGRLFGSILSAPGGLTGAYRLWRAERREHKQAMNSVGGDFGTVRSIRELGTASRFGSYIRELDVEKYNQILSRMLLETVTEYLGSNEVDTSAFEGAAASIVNGDVNIAKDIHGGEVQQGGRRNRYGPPATAGVREHG
jgi:hypothetical protein